MSAFSDPVLATSPSGRIQRCTCCAGCVVGWAGASVTLPPVGLDRLRSAADEIARAGARRCRLRVQTPHQHVTLTLWPGDAGELRDLIQAALATLAIDRQVSEILS